jgi:mRNA interferase RelE/StbE
MESFKVEIKNSVYKDLRRIDKKQVPRILKIIEEFCQDPNSIQSEKLSGFKDFYKIRVGEYRIIYRLNTQEKKIIVFHVKDRKESYKKPNIR